MRNLKKIVSLVLAMMMVLSLMVTASATDFADDAAIEHKEAVEVLTGLGVINGVGDKFLPKDKLNREAAAKIVAYIMEGGELDTTITAAMNNPFTDVNGWSVDVIKYCYANGIVDGVGNGTFLPKDYLTGYAFGKMVLMAAGIDGEYTGGNWKVNIATALKDNGILAGIEKVALSGYLTREQACQMAFNAMQVSATGKTVYPVVDANGDEIAVFDSSNEAMLYVAILGDGYALGKAYLDSTGSLADKVFGLSAALDTDDFGRTTKVWTASEVDDCYVVLPIGAPVYTTTTATTAAAIAKALKGYYIQGSTLKRLVEDTTFTDAWTGGKSGTLVRENGSTVSLGAAAENSGKVTLSAALAALTGNGKQVEIYANKKEITKIVVVDYATDTLKVETNKTTGDVTYTVNTNVTGTVYADGKTPATVVLNGEFADKDIVTYVKAGDNLYLFPTTKITGTITAKTSAGVYTIGGANYANSSFNSTSYAVNPLTAFNYYLDQFGYIACAENYVEAASTNYLYANASDTKVASSFGALTPSVKVHAVLADGTVAVYDLALTKKVVGEDDSAYYGWFCGDVQLNTSAIDSSWTAASVLNTNVYGYTVNEDGALVLETIGTDKAANTVFTESASGEFISGVTKVANSLLTANTVYVVYNPVTGTATVFTGSAALAKVYSKLPAATKIISTGISTTLGNANVVFAPSGTAVGASTVDYAYIDATDYVESVDVYGKYFVYTGILADGTTVTLAKYGTALASDASGLYTYLSNGLVDSLINLSEAEDTDGLFAGSAQIIGSMLKIGDNYYNYAGASIVELGVNSLNDESAVEVIYQMDYIPGVGYSTTDIAAIFVK